MQLKPGLPSSVTLQPAQGDVEKVFFFIYVFRMHLQIVAKRVVLKTKHFNFSTIGARLVTF